LIGPTRREDRSIGSSRRQWAKIGLRRTLRRRRLCGDGATLAELVAATGWLPHTTRAALTGLRKRGYAVGIDRADKVRGSVYRIEPTEMEEDSGRHLSDQYDSRPPRLEAAEAVGVLQIVRISRDAPGLVALAILINPRKARPHDLDAHAFPAAVRAIIEGSLAEVPAGDAPLAGIRPVRAHPAEVAVGEEILGIGLSILRSGDSVSNDCLANLSFGRQDGAEAHARQRQQARQTQD